MLDLFERAEALVNIIGQRPWVIHADSILPHLGRKYGLVFEGIDNLARSFCGVANRHLTNEQLDGLSANESSDLQDTHRYLDISANVICTQLRVAPAERDASRSGPIQLLVNASNNAHTVGVVASASDRADACQPDAAADLAYATLQAFIAYAPLYDVFMINEHPRRKAELGLLNLEQSLAPRSLGVLFQQMLVYMELTEDHIGREGTVMALREMIPTTTSLGFSDAQTVALSGLAGIWCDKTAFRSVSTGLQIAGRRESLEKHVGPELQKLAQWLDKKESAWSVRENRHWLLDTLPTIPMDLAGW